MLEGKAATKAAKRGLQIGRISSSIVVVFVNYCPTYNELWVAEPNHCSESILGGPG